MKPSVSMPALRELWHQLFPRHRRRALLGQIDPGLHANRHRAIQPWGLVQAVMTAFVRCLPGLRAMSIQCRLDLIGGQPRGPVGASALSYALRQPWALALARALFQALPGSNSQPKPDELVAVDSTGVTLPARRRHGCALVNSQTAGCAALWAFRLAAPRGTNPIQVLSVVRGGWSDAKLIGQAKLLANGPVYLFDRGFYKIEQIAAWLGQGIRFVSRVPGTPQFTAVARLSNYKGDGRKLVVHFDGVVDLGSPRRSGPRPQVRLIWAWTPTAGRLILATSELGWSAARVLEAYRQRWQIERWHLYLKENQCLAHLYSFQANGLEFVLWCSLLLTATLFTLVESSGRPLSVDCMSKALAAVRRSLGLWHPWRPNTTRKNYRGRRKPPPDDQEHEGGARTPARPQPPSPSRFSIPDPIPAYHSPL